MNKLKADQEITISKKLREALKVLAAKLKNDLRTQLDATNDAVQRRIFDLSKAWDRLVWQKGQVKPQFNKELRPLWLHRMRGDIKLDLYDHYFFW